MRRFMALLTAVGFVTVAGCAATSPSADDTVKFHLSDRAEKLVEEEGKSVAAMRGHDRDSKLVCEKHTKTGTHITHNVCYTRDEMEQRRLNHQEQYRRKTARGADCGNPEQC